MRDEINNATISYLLEGDHSIRWQVLEDLIDGSDDDIHYDRMMIEIEGWGSQILEAQDENGLWDQSLTLNSYTSTLWTLVRLYRMGIYPLDHFYLPCEKLLTELTFDGGMRWEGKDEKHICLGGLTLMVQCYFKYQDAKSEAIYHYLIEKQLDDGSWYCPHHDSEEEAIFATTMAVLEGLNEYQKFNRKEHNRIEDMKTKAHDFILDHHVILKNPGDETVEIFEEFTRFPFPYFRYDILTVLDYFRSIGMKRDPRLQLAIDHLKGLSEDNKWKSFEPDGEEHIAYDAGSVFSRFNTLRAWRVLRHFR